MYRVQINEKRPRNSGAFFVWKTSQALLEGIRKTKLNALSACFFLFCLAFFCLWHYTKKSILSLIEKNSTVIAFTEKKACDERPKAKAYAFAHYFIPCKFVNRPSVP